MTCRRCPSLSPITVEQAGVELCRVCAQLPAEKTNAPDCSEASDRHHDRPTRERQAQSPARPARSKR